ncbi:MAG: hypothetical protein CVT74_01725 [Alphaproteobacteria bacterium HGW-Alphaproteobacteria-13]|jgi:hypothetical protein|nr:MAG: hypothetical protein CVT74_01725 [Alphaproteobacteria bacterium HGW-Alphaproteobacteria-13]
MIQFAIQRDDTHLAVHVNGPANTYGKRATLAHRLGSRFDDQATALVAAFDQVRHGSAGLDADLKPEALTRRLRADTREHWKPAADALCDSIQTARRSHAERLAVLSTPPADPHIAAEDRATFHALSAGRQWNWIAAADRNGLAAIVSGGRSRFNGDDATWDAATERLMRLTFIEQSGAQGRFPLQPTPENPAPVGPDIAAAEAFAAERIAEFQAEREQADAAEALLRDSIKVAAVIGDMPIDDAFALLTDEPT